MTTFQYRTQYDGTLTEAREKRLRAVEWLSQIDRYTSCVVTDTTLSPYRRIQELADTEALQTFYLSTNTAPAESPPAPDNAAARSSALRARDEVLAHFRHQREQLRQVGYGSRKIKKVQSCPLSGTKPSTSKVARTSKRHAD